MGTTIINGRKVIISDKLLAVLGVLEEARKGGFAFIKNAIFESKRDKPETACVWFTSRFSYMGLLEKKVGALTALVSVEGVEAELFAKAKGELLASAQKTLSGDRTGGAREGHDRCFIPVCEGVKIHLITKKVGDRMEPVLTNGIPMAKSVQVQALEVARKVVEAGVYTPVKSQPKTIAKRAIEKALKAQGIKTPKSFTLQEDRFECLSIDGNQIPVDAVAQEDDD